MYMYASVVFTHSLVEPPESYTWNFLAGSFQRVKLLFAFFKTLPEDVHQQNQQVHKKGYREREIKGRRQGKGIPRRQLCAGRKRTQVSQRREGGGGGGGEP